MNVDLGGDKGLRSSGSAPVGTFQLEGLSIVPRLLRQRASVFVVSPEVPPQLSDHLRQKRILSTNSTSDLHGKSLVFVACYDWNEVYCIIYDIIMEAHKRCRLPCIVWIKRKSAKYVTSEECKQHGICLNWC